MNPFWRKRKRCCTDALSHADSPFGTRCHRPVDPKPSTAGPGVTSKKQICFALSRVNLIDYFPKHVKRRYLSRIRPATRDSGQGLDFSPCPVAWVGKTGSDDCEILPATQRQ